MLAAQGVYYILTGLWPLVSMQSFELVTGPKTDDWLVQTVGLLLAVIGMTLLARARRARPAADTRLLSGGTALAVGGRRARISRRNALGVFHERPQIRRLW